MATREHIKCPACGSQRRREAFGIDEWAGYDPESAIGYEAQHSIQTIGGRGKCSWDHHDLTPHLAGALRARLHDVLRDLEREMLKAGIELKNLDEDPKEDQTSG